MSGKEIKHEKSSTKKEADDIIKSDKKKDVKKVNCDNKEKPNLGSVLPSKEEKPGKKRPLENNEEHKDHAKKVKTDHQAAQCGDAKDSKEKDLTRGKNKDDKKHIERPCPKSHKTENDHHKLSHKREAKCGPLDDKEKKPKRQKREESSDEDEEEDRRVKEKAARLEQMKKEAAKASSPRTEQKEKPRPPINPDSPPSSSSSPSSSGKAPAEKNTWMSHDQLYVFTSKGVVPSAKIAAFDIDGTIILTKSGKKFPTDSSDWRIAYPEAFKKLKELARNGYKIVFFTNQLGVARGKVKVEELKKKIENIAHTLQVPVQAFVATHEGKYRKPCDGMWRKLKHQYNAGVAIDKEESFYVGDAAGRPANWGLKKPKDFSSSDRLFALNVRVKFHTPEAFFQGQREAPFTMPAFDPRSLRSDAPLIPEGYSLSASKREILVLVGFPACGKSHLANNVLKKKGYFVVNRDTLGNWQKCVRVTKEAVVNSKVVIDNTNLTKEERGRYVNCAKEAGVDCRCLVFTTTIEHCRHNERFRQLTDKSHAKINEMIFNKNKSKFEEPSCSEGFSEIINVNFVPSFSSSSLEADYRKFLLEK